MPVHSNEAPAEPTPTPASTERNVSTPRDRFRDAFSCASAAGDAAAYGEARRRFSGDIAQEIDAIRAGRHPLQRRELDLDAWSRIEGELAEIRAKLAVG